MPIAITALTVISMTVPTSVEIYTTPGCSYCSRAKGFLKKRGVQYEEKDVSMSPLLLDEMIRRADCATMPQIFVAGEHVGGCTDMLNQHAQGTLAPRLQAAGIEMLDVPEPTETVLALSPPPFQKGRRGGVLNAPIFGTKTAPPANAAEAAALSVAMQRQMLSLLDDFALEDGSGADLAALCSSPGFAAFLDLAGCLCALPLEGVLGVKAPPAESKAFWLNLYNVLVLHSTAVLGAPKDGKERDAYFTGKSGAAYTVGGLTFCLDDMEHGVLRGNAPTVGGQTLFAADDARLPYALPRPVDPRIHFALNCGARSCPPIKVYTATRLDQELDLATRAFLEDDLVPDVPAGVLTCTKLLDWYGGDFGADERARVARLCELLPTAAGTLKAALEELAVAPQGVTLVYKPYDWGSDVDAEAATA